MNEREFYNELWSGTGNRPPILTAKSAGGYGGGPLCYEPFLRLRQP